MSAPFIGHTSSASHDRQCNCLACREGRVTSANPHGWADDNEIPLCPLGPVSMVRMRLRSHFG